MYVYIKKGFVFAKKSSIENIMKKLLTKTNYRREIFNMHENALRCLSFIIENLMMFSNELYQCRLVGCLKGLDTLKRLLFESGAFTYLICAHCSY